ncbi:hypothetical protein AC579_2953 [Pseudocercospora musae]|uniref:Uncharacterized protein n=1 Tax=Pseudocercospora musae TaxID=113226 RepID=A0A139I670_9PEZI|nr:hypothetical protein AC579_2953 [Pseudocercospora musae]
MLSNDSGAEVKCRREGVKSLSVYQNGLLLHIKARVAEFCLFSPPQYGDTSALQQREVWRA